MEPAASDTVTLATGAGVTVIGALPLFASLVAVILAVPTATAVTPPSGETVATAVLSELHATARPVRVAPFESKVVAVACDVPTAVMDVGARATLTEATGIGVTVIDAVPLFPSLEAVIVAVPTATDVTRPLASTVAIVWSLDDHNTIRPASTWSAASLVSALSCWVEPTVTLAAAGLTVTDATGTGTTVRVAAPDFPSLVAVITADPATIDVTTPVLETVATVKSSDVHVTTRPVRTAPFMSSVVAVA
jgi:hypothetical protein